MLPWIWSMYAWMLIVCVVVSFSGNRIEWRLCGGGWSIWVSGGGWSGTSQPRQAIYLLHIWILLSHYALFYSCFHYYALFFLYCYYSLNSNSWRLSSASRFIIIYEGWHLWHLLNTPESRDSMISIEVFGKTCSGAKNSRMGKTLWKVSKMVAKTLE
jgi:hypothetical protein